MIFDQLMTAFMEAVGHSDGSKGVSDPTDSNSSTTSSMRDVYNDVDHQKVLKTASRWNAEGSTQKQIVSRPQHPISHIPYPNSIMIDPRTVDFHPVIW